MAGVVRVAGGVFAPGHLGELTQHLPFEMVDEALAQAGGLQRRLRDLPSRVVVYLLLAACLFPELGYRQVWARMVSGLAGMVVAAPTAAALCQARRRVGVAPLRWLFELLRGPAAGIAVRGTRWHGLLICAIDGTVMSVADSPANLTEFSKQRCNNGGAGYPSLRLTALVACGTRTIIDAVFGPATTGEQTAARHLARSLHPGMVLLLDRNFAGADLVGELATTGAQILVRLKNNRTMPVLTRHRDGSYLSLLGKVKVRVIDAEITLTSNGGKRTGIYRLATTVLDHRHYPARDLVTLYHQRWEIETTYLELTSTILGGRVLRARTPQGVTQEIYALLIVHQLLRTAMTDATSTRTDIDPDRASFTIALNTARDLLIQATAVIAEATIDLVGTIGRHILANPMPDRRTRTSPRTVKRAISKYNTKGTIDRTSYKTTLTINIHTPPQPTPTTN